jgi:hypothetical protein
MHPSEMYWNLYGRSGSSRVRRDNVYPNIELILILGFVSLVLFKNILND